MAANQEVKCSLILTGKPGAIAGVCKKLFSVMKTQDYTSDDIFAVRLAVEEAFANAVKHGNNSDMEKKITVDYIIDGQKVDIRITDEGTGFNPAGIPDPRCGENIYKTQGRGLFLIRSYMNIVEYNQAGNCIHMQRFKNSSPVVNGIED